jgi:hypothetical protein
VSSTLLTAAATAALCLQLLPLLWLLLDRRLATAAAAVLLHR